ncbi:MAG: UbiA prenyltransferase family protein [Alphaproteobacteria bacterium]|nr:UbiA prenyltransferase family protein [Alphaproteobacteria bacterium]MCB9696402.1 UbiA prenyltransferase family protein [Alphaproteobacteria bacterium]
MAMVADLWTLARPRLMPFVVGLVVLGFAWAHWDRALVVRGGADLLVVCAAWALLHAGTLWLNAALDRDEGEVLFGRAVTPPPGTALAAYVALVACVFVAAVANPISAACAAACAGLAVAYSHPATAWKGHPLGGPLVNLVGYGLLSPLAGWAVVGVDWDARTAAVWPLAAIGVLGTYFAAQAFQEEEDRARGYRTLVATHGSRVVLLAARVALGTTALGGVVLLAMGWVPLVCAVGIPGWWIVDRYLVAWSHEPHGGSEKWARGFALRLGVLLLVGIALAFSDYAWDSFHDRPVAGLGTAGGHPPDRPLLSPRAMRAWERATSR